MKQCKLWLLSISVFITPLFSMESYNANLLNLIPKRTNQYAIGKYKRVIVLSPTRSGSTLIYNVARTLFEESKNATLNGLKIDSPCLVKKSHCFQRKYFPNTLYLCPYRNPYDMISSRSFLDKDRYGKKLLSISQARVNNAGSVFKALYDIKNKPNVLLLKYEDFVDNFEYIFKKLENFLHIKINPSDKKLISKNCSKEAVNKLIKNLSTFNEYDKVSHLHGNHIAKKPLTPRQRRNLCKIATPRLKHFEYYINAFGYSLDHK